MEISFTKEELQKRAKQYLVGIYGLPKDSENCDKWMERFGLLSGFIDEQFEPNHE